MGTSLPLLLSELHILEVLGNSFANHCCFLEENQNKQELVVVALMGSISTLWGICEGENAHLGTQPCDGWQC